VPYFLAGDFFYGTLLREIYPILYYKIPIRWRLKLSLMMTKINITKKKKRVLGLVMLGILVVFLAGCSEQQTTTTAQVTNENTQPKQSDVPQEIPKNPGNFSPQDGQMPPQDGNFTPGTRPNLPPEGNFAPPDRQMPPQDGNFSPHQRPDFPKDGNFAPPDKK